MEENAVICVIVNQGLGQRVLGLASLHPVLRDITVTGIGTSHTSANMYKDLVFLYCRKEVTAQILQEFSKEMAMEEPDRGIAFVLGQVPQKETDLILNIVRVKRGFAEDVIVISQEAECHGATVIRGRNVDRLSIFPKENLELVLMITAREKSEKLTAILNRDEKFCRQANLQGVTMALSQPLGITYY